LGYEPNELPGCSTPRQVWLSRRLRVAQPNKFTTRAGLTQGFSSFYLFYLSVLSVRALSQPPPWLYVRYEAALFAWQTVSDSE
jgi:hypothetical protein